MARTRVSLQQDPTKEERLAIKAQTTERIRALTGDEAKELLEELIARNEVTGILVFAREFVDKVALSEISTS